MASRAPSAANSSTQEPLTTVRDAKWLEEAGKQASEGIVFIEVNFPSVDTFWKVISG